MSYSVPEQVAGIVGRLLDNTLSLDGFTEEFVGATWEALDGPDAKLVGEIELLLAEFTSGHLPENELRAELEWLVFGHLRESSDVVAASDSDIVEYRVVDYSDKFITPPPVESHGLSAAV